MNTLNSHLIHCPELKLPDTTWLAGARIHAFKNGNKLDPISFSAKHPDRQTVQLAPAASDVVTLIEDALNYAKRYMLFIEFVLDSAQCHRMLPDYEASTPWTYAITLMPLGDYMVDTHWTKAAQFNRSGNLAKREAYRQSFAGYVIMRHPRFGEEPNHKWYSKHFGAEYQYPWKSSQKTNEGNKKKV